jgi:hypothetical protein
MNTFKDFLNEKVDKYSPIYKEYLQLKKLSIKSLRDKLSRNYKVVDLKGYDKEGAISQILRDKYGNKKVDKVFNESKINEKVEYMNLNQLKKQLKKDYGSKASSLKIVKIKGGVSIQTPSGQELERYNNVPKLGYTVVEEKNPRIPRKKGQPANSKKHSDLYTDENPKGTIKGLGFKDVETAEKSVKKIENSGKTHAHKVQAAIAMEQRARVMGKKAEAAVYRKFINKMKKITKSKNESLEESRADLMKNAEYLKLINQAMSAMPGSPKQKGIIKKINAIRVKAGFKALDEADGCWDGFKKVGMKKKGNKLVPNCIPEGKGKPESWESGFERRVVKTTKPEHKEKGYDWRIKGKDRAEVTIKLYRTKPSFAEFKKQMRRVAGHEFGG